MAVNKVIYGTTVLVDLTEDTVTPSALAQGYTAHDKSGAAITGTATGGSMIIRDEQDSHGGTVREITAGSVVQGTKTIAENGTYDVAEFADASVNVPRGPTYTATLISSGQYTSAFVQLNGEGTRYYTLGQTIEFHSGDFLRVCMSGTPVSINVDDELVAESTSGALTYDYQLPDGNLSIRFVIGNNGCCYITLSTLNVTVDGIYDVSQYLKANVTVAGHTATITHTVGSTYSYPYIQVNGTGDKYYADGAVFKFNDGDTFRILLQGSAFGGTLYLNGTQIYNSGLNAASYTWTPPSCDLSIDIQTAAAGAVYVTTPVMNISANGSYEVPGYGYVNVSV